MLEEGQKKQTPVVVRHFLFLEQLFDSFKNLWMCWFSFDWRIHQLMVGSSLFSGTAVVTRFYSMREWVGRIQVSMIFSTFWNILLHLVIIVSSVPSHSGQGCPQYIRIHHLRKQQTEQTSRCARVDSWGILRKNNKIIQVQEWTWNLVEKKNICVFEGVSGIFFFLFLRPCHTKLGFWPKFR